MGFTPAPDACWGRWDWRTICSSCCGRNDDERILTLPPTRLAPRSADLRSGAFRCAFEYLPGRRPALRGQCQDAVRDDDGRILTPPPCRWSIPSPTTEEWGEGKGEGIPISRANSMEGAPLPTPLPARAPQEEGAGGFHHGGTIQMRPMMMSARIWR